MTRLKHTRKTEGYQPSPNRTVLVLTSNLERGTGSRHVYGVKKAGPGKQNDERFWNLAVQDHAYGSF